MYNVNECQSKDLMRSLVATIITPAVALIARFFMQDWKNKFRPHTLPPPLHVSHVYIDFYYQCLYGLFIYVIHFVYKSMKRTDVHKMVKIYYLDICNVLKIFYLNLSSVSHIVGHTPIKICDKY